MPKGRLHPDEARRHGLFQSLAEERLFVLSVQKPPVRVLIGNRLLGAGILAVEIVHGGIE